MASHAIIALTSMACVSLAYAFITDIRLSREAGRLRRRVRDEYPELWAAMHSFARSWKGGLPALKVLRRLRPAELREFDRDYERLRRLERRVLWGIVVGSVCIGFVMIGSLLRNRQW